MATQRLTVASLAGIAGRTTEALFRSWRAAGPALDPVAVDQFCAALRSHGTSLPVIYFAEWVDRWLMGNVIPGPGSIDGRQYQAICLSPDQATAWAGHCGNQFPEQRWFARRLREAAKAWGKVVDLRVIVVLREILGVTTTDGEVRAALGTVPDWLAAGDAPAQ